MAPTKESARKLMHFGRENAQFLGVLFVGAATTIVTGGKLFLTIRTLRHELESLRQERLGGRDLLQESLRQERLGRRELLEKEQESLRQERLGRRELFEKELESLRQERLGRRELLEKERLDRRELLEKERLDRRELFEKDIKKATEDAVLRIELDLADRLQVYEDYSEEYRLWRKELLTKVASKFR